LRSKLEKLGKCESVYDSCTRRIGALIPKP
jgi:hypothetical protein